ncbi:hypothetical protein [Kitasatospora fiedleri]|uniref:hypothetical protein n=1 Tax=Kitasatospora fiedleri TaxID=2991545 RepID=UPI00249B10DB|nr:hypothetical protein [Kitasatospora fiedleri]
MTARSEAVAAASWWALRLAEPSHQNVGHPDANTLLAALANTNARAYTPDQVEAYRVALTARIEAHLAQSEWSLAEPIFGSEVRCLYNDYSLDPVLTEAAATAGIEVGVADLPLKTVMWIDPGKVSVRSGYGSEVETVWDWRWPWPPTTPATGANGHPEPDQSQLGNISDTPPTPPAG